MNTKHLQLLGAAALSAISISPAVAQSAQPSVNTPVTQLHYGATGVTDGVHGELKRSAPRVPAIWRMVHTVPSSRCREGLVQPAPYSQRRLLGSRDLRRRGQRQAGQHGRAASGGIGIRYQKGGEPHVTKCISPNECIFFVSQHGKFDYVPSAAKQGATSKVGLRSPASATSNA